MRKYVALLCLLCCAAWTQAGFLFDDFSDNNYTANPAWVVESGPFSAEGEFGVGPGVLGFSRDYSSTIHLDFPQVAVNVPITIEFDLFQSYYAYPSGLRFFFNVMDAAQPNKSYNIQGALTSPYYGNSGFSSFDSAGQLIGGVDGKSLLNGWQHVVIKFDPATGVEMSYGGEVVSSFPNFNGLSRIDRLTLSSGNGTPWFVDNVRIASPTIVPQKSSIVVDGNVSDWPATSQWSDPFVYWNGAGSNAITQAKFAWNDAQDLLYVAIKTNEVNGGHAAVGFSKDLAGIPNTGLGSTQLAFDIASSNNVNVMNEISYYVGLYPSLLWPEAGIDGVEAKYSFNNADGTYTYEIAIPLWQDWRTGEPKVKQLLTTYDKVYVYSVMETGLATAAGTNLSWIGNPAFSNGAFSKGAMLILDSDPTVQDKVLYQDNFNRADAALVGSTVSNGNFSWASTGSYDSSLNIVGQKLSINSAAGANGAFYVNCDMDPYERYKVSLDLTVRSHGFDALQEIFYFRGRSAPTTVWYGYQLSYYYLNGGVFYGYFASPTQSSVNLGLTMLEVNKPIRVMIEVNGNTSTVTIGALTYQSFTDLATYNDGVPDYITFGNYFADGFGEAFVVDNLTVTVQVSGDANRDGMVDVGDLGILAANYGGTGKTWGQGDFNGDGLVDVGDLGILAAHYGEGVSASVEFNNDYSKAFGTMVADEADSADETAGSMCSALGLPLIAGLVLIGLMLVKLEE